MQRAYDSLGQFATQYQSHSGTVNVNSTPKVQYADPEMSGGANHSRLTSITYPDGYVVNYNYSSGLNDAISRLSSLSDTSGTLAPRRGAGVEEDRDTSMCTSLMLSRSMDMGSLRLK